MILWADARLVSPWALLVFAALIEKQVPFRLETIDLLAGDHRRGPYLEKTLTAKVPALRHGDLWIAESLAILEYLEEVFAPPRHPALLPRDVAGRARDRHILSFVRSDLFELRRCAPFPSIFMPFAAPPMTERARAEAAKLLRLVELRQPCAHPTLADLELGLAVRRLVHHRLEVPPAAAAYADAIWARPSVQGWLALRRERRLLTAATPAE